MFFKKGKKKNTQKLKVTKILLKTALLNAAWLSGQMQVKLLLAALFLGCFILECRFSHILKETEA